MNCNEREDPITAARELILCINTRIPNNEAKSLALVNSRAELDFELRLALLLLGNYRPLSQNNESLSKYAHSLVKVLMELDGNDNDGRLKTEVPPRRPQHPLARNSGHEAKPPRLSPIRLPERAKGLTTTAQQISGLRKPNSSPPEVQLDLEVGRDRPSTHHRTTIQEGSDGNKVDKSEKENERRNFKTSETGLSRNGRDPNCSVDRKVPATVEPQFTAEQKRLGEEFMRQADKFYKEKIEPLKKREIKVAVLDTGVDQKEIHFKAVRGRLPGTSIKKAKSFIDDDPHDIDGHGTQVAALVVEMARHVGLYVAKVCKRKETETKAKGQFVKAIDWAMEHKVHIITISAAIDTDDEIRDAINKAEAQGIIVFAAASNDGANSPRAFPASMDKVLAIHATDGHGNPCGFNPNFWHNHFNFSTLGTGVPSPFKEGEFLRGTSFSTPIAAGMAANILILADARLNQTKRDQSLRRSASTREGMKAIFADVSQVRHNYHYLCPTWVGRDTAEDERSWLRYALRYL